MAFNYFSFCCLYKKKRLALTFFPLMGLGSKLTFAIIVTCITLALCLMLTKFWYNKKEAYDNLMVKVNYAKNFAESETFINPSVRASMGYYSSMCADTEHTSKTDVDQKVFQMALD